PFGFKRERYTTDDGRESVRDVPHPEQAPLVKEAAERVLAGDSLRSIAASWDERGIPAPRSAKWTAATIKQMLKRQSNAGLRTFRVEITTKPNRTPIYYAGTHTRLMALFSNPSRTTGAGNAPEHLLSTIARC